MIFLSSVFTKYVKHSQYPRIHIQLSRKIQWTSSGDAFVIGADLKRLEEETLPQYFRHNRFQSLVRQLNFYSFRKINKERNVWIYKHHLFRRDSPEDLRLVRRRTCPGLDGRKQRFARIGAKKQIDREKSITIKSDEESYCGGSTSSGVSVAEEYGSSNTEGVKEHEDIYGICETASPAFLLASLSESGNNFIRVNPILPVTISSDTLESDNQSTSELVDTAIVESDVVCAHDESEHFDCAVPILSSRAEKAKQSNIVSEVAMKLDQYAKKAMYVRGGYRTRRGVCGVVTPPSSLNGSRGLITYDDEPYFDGDDYDLGPLLRPVSRNSSEINELNHAEFPPRKSVIGYPNLVTTTKPVADRKTVDAIVQRIMHCQVEKTIEATMAIANVAGFCMSILPDYDHDVRGKILHFTSSCEPVATEFRLYRTALHPVQLTDCSPAYILFNDSSPDLANFKHGVDAVPSVPRVEATQSEVVREFSVFAVNCLHKVLSKRPSIDVTVDCLTPMVLHPADFAILQRTAEIWQRSVAINCHFARRI